jgi:glutamine synthetase
MMTGRTLLGHTSAKGQQLDDHYFGSIPTVRVNVYERFKARVYVAWNTSKTRHEVAPNQFEFAPIFEETNLAVDHNCLLMDVMQKWQSVTI